MRMQGTLKFQGSIVAYYIVRLKVMANQTMYGSTASNWAILSSVHVVLYQQEPNKLVTHYNGNNQI